MVKKQTISVLITAKNEEQKISRCLKSVLWADEVVLIDSHSKDNTLKIAKQIFSKQNTPPLKIFQFNKKKYLIEEKKNFGIGKAKKNWIFILDADEEVLSQLKEEIVKSIQKTKHNAFNVHFQTHFFRHSLRGSFFSDMPVIRLFRKGKAKYATLSPHSLLSVNGTTGSLKTKVNHYAYKDTNEFLTKSRRYAKQAAPYLLKNRVGGVLTKPLKNLNFYSCYVEPMLFSLWIFFRKKMYKDFFVGFWISLLMGYYLYLERREVKILKNKKELGKKR